MRINLILKLEYFGFGHLEKFGLLLSRQHLEAVTHLGEVFSKVFEQLYFLRLVGNSFS